MCHVLQLNERQGWSGPHPPPNQIPQSFLRVHVYVKCLHLERICFKKKTRMFIILSGITGPRCHRLIEIILNPDSYIYISDRSDSK